MIIYQRSFFVLDELITLGFLLEEICFSLQSI